VRDRLAVSKRAAQKVDKERFDVKELNEGDVKEQYQVTIRNKFAALENLEDSGDINGAWDNIRENINISAQESLGYCESKNCKPRFGEECSKLADRRKQAKLQWVQDPIEVNENYLSNARQEDSKHIRKEKREYLNDYSNETKLNKTVRIRILEICIGAQPNSSRAVNVELIWQKTIEVIYKRSPIKF
jgi:hypothetical protein